MLSSKERGLKMLVIAERLNASRKPVKEALKNRNEQFFLDEVKTLIERGSDFIDINASHIPEAEISDLLWLIDLLKDRFQIPFAIDSSTPEVIEAGLKRLNRSGQMINSTTLEPKKFEKLIQLMLEHQANLVVLLMDESHPRNTEERIRLMEKLARLIEQRDVPPERVFIDPLVFTLSTDVKNGIYVIETICEIKKRFNHFKTTVGLSNISYGLPNRRLLNRTFLSMLIPLGLDSALIDPLDDELMAVLKAGMALSGKDPYCLHYLEAYRKGSLGK